MKDERGRTLNKKAWSPYVVGIGIGLLGWFVFATAHRSLGITTAFGKVTLPQITNTSPWLWIFGLGIAAVVILPFLKSRTQTPKET
jgi:hypothetical protein